MYYNTTLTITIAGFFVLMRQKSKQQFAKALGIQIKKARISKGISLKHFEAKDGAIDRHDLSRIESGQKVPNLYTIYRICLTLEIELKDLFQNFNLK